MIGVALLVFGLEVRANNEECGLLDAFDEYKSQLNAYPTYKSIKQLIDYDGFLLLADDLSEKTYFQKEARNKEVLLRAEGIIWRTVWVDKSIGSISKYVELCSKNIGELIVEATYVGTGKETEIIRFKRSDRGWVRGAPSLSRKSSINNKDKSEILAEVVVEEATI
jgi:hypothetical protein